jgi:UDPglucose--hexose-1-phosphate uridylyltransferase
VVPNKYPALTPTSGASVGRDVACDEFPGTGRHEVVIETPMHGRVFSRMPPAEIHSVLRVYQQRLQALSQEPGVRWVSLFRNEGRAAGASQEHAHAQLLALPLVPPRVAAELEATERYFQATARCFTCDALARELHDGSRMVVESETYAAVATFAPRFPYEVWVLPRYHRHDFARVPDAELVELAALLQRTLIGLESVLGMFPYNLILQTAPNAGGSHEPSFHWRFEIVPRTTIVSGLELGTDIHIVAQSPERAALTLRRAIADV